MRFGSMKWSVVYNRWNVSVLPFLDKSASKWATRGVEAVGGLGGAFSDCYYAQLLNLR